MITVNIMNSQIHFFDNHHWHSKDKDNTAGLNLTLLIFKCDLQILGAKDNDFVYPSIHLTLKHVRFNLCMKK